jgi:hypothetical protein
VCSRDTREMVYGVGMVEDDSLLRLSVCDALANRDDGDIVSASDTGADVIVAAQAGGLDVALLAAHVGSGPEESTWCPQ